MIFVPRNKMRVCEVIPVELTEVDDEERRVIKIILVPKPPERIYIKGGLR